MQGKLVGDGMQMHWGRACFSSPRTVDKKRKASVLGQSLVDQLGRGMVHTDLFPPRATLTRLVPSSFNLCFDAMHNIKLGGARLKCAESSRQVEIRCEGRQLGCPVLWGTWKSGYMTLHVGRSSRENLTRGTRHRWRSMISINTLIVGLAKQLHLCRVPALLLYRYMLLLFCSLFSSPTGHALSLDLSSVYDLSKCLLAIHHGSQWPRHLPAVTCKGNQVPIHGLIPHRLIRSAGMSTPTDLFWLLDW